MGDCPTIQLYLAVFIYVYLYVIIERCFQIVMFFFFLHLGTVCVELLYVSFYRESLVQSEVSKDCIQIDRFRIKILGA